ncbi:MAG: type I glutamate--ammonia ligase [Anaerolineae bacterium]|jgi:glutamine synthetase|nr:type I glutamate--ammonia ligase [Anaerolineae bacterium]
MATELTERVKEDKIQFISMQFSDILGNTKSVTIPVDQLPRALKDGIWFDGSSIEGFARIYESDRILIPDPRTYRVLPWSVPERRRARLFCDVYGPDGTPSPSDPRTALRRMTARAAEMGYIYNTGPELEFFIFEHNNNHSIHPVPYDVVGYFDFSPRDTAQQVRSEIVLALKALGIEVEMSHHEVATGQHEIDFHYATALHSADNAVTFKYTVQAIAATHGLYASFMPKPIFGINGSGMHVHQSFSNAEGQNLFYDADAPYHLSSLAESFVAGQMAHARALAAVVAPTVNSYKRLTPGYEAPVYICWANRNRSALIRVPGTVPGNQASTRIELRCPDPSANPYLAFTAMLAAGLDGIAKGMKAPEMVNEDIYHFDQEELNRRSIATLPGTLAEALEELEKDDVLLDALGDSIAETFMRAKWAEWEEYRIQVTPWELNRYLETA